MKMRSLLFSLLVLLTATSPLARALGPSADVSLGYSRVGANAFNANTPALDGWQGAFHIKLRQHTGFEADIAHYGWGSSDSTLHTTSVNFGPRASVSVPGINIYAHGLVGVANSSRSSGSASNAVSVLLGGGVGVPLFPFLKLRVSGDYIGTTASTDSATKRSPYRINAGVAFHF